MTNISRLAIVVLIFFLLGVLLGCWIVKRSLDNSFYAMRKQVKDLEDKIDEHEQLIQTQRNVIEHKDYSIGVLYNQLKEQGADATTSARRDE